MNILMDGTQKNLILSNEELERIFTELEISQLENIGTLDWFKKRDAIIKLYQMAMIQAKSNQQEAVVEGIVKWKKVQFLVEEAITVGLWREQIYPELMMFEPEPVHTFPTYLVLYHEGMTVSLLQVLVYHPQVIESLADSARDLAEYCVLHLVRLDVDAEPLTADDIHERGKQSTKESIRLQQRQVADALAAQSLGVLRHMLDCLNSLSPGVSRYLYCDADVPVLVADRLLAGAWTRHKNNALWKYHDNAWRPWHAGDPALSSTECQAWLLLYQLIAAPQAYECYELTSFRRERLSQLSGLLHDGVIDMLAPLKDLKYILNTQILNCQPARRHTGSSLIVEITTSFRETIVKKYTGRYKDLAKNASKLLFYGSEENIRNLAVAMAYQLSQIDEVTDAFRNCHSCYMKANKKCSRCKKVWYCSPSCQQQHWPSHKLVCR